jgi:hypothetical protein
MDSFSPEFAQHWLAGQPGAADERFGGDQTMRCRPPNRKP